MSVGLIAQLITSHITKFVLDVLFYLLAHPGCHTGTGEILKFFRGMVWV